MIFLGRAMVKVAIIGMSLALAAVAGATSASAQSCDSEITRLQQRYGLSDQPSASAQPTPPEASGGTAPADTATARRGQSGGVVGSPDASGPLNIQPPGGHAGSNAPATQPLAGGFVGTDNLPGPERSRLAALLAAARSAARQGNDQECRDRLREAQALPPVPKSE